MAKPETTRLNIKTVTRHNTLLLFTIDLLDLYGLMVNSNDSRELRLVELADLIPPFQKLVPHMAAKWSDRQIAYVSTMGRFGDLELR